MKKDNFMMALLLAVSISTNAQDYYQKDYKTSSSTVSQTACATIGILQGGGSLVGVDLEFLLSDRFGAQVGFGLVGFGGGINYHFQPGVRSSFVSLQYWNQGIGDSFVQSLVGPSYVFRGDRWFTFQLGLGAILELGEDTPYEDGEEPPVILTYAIGVYLPW